MSDPSKAVMDKLRVLSAGGTWGIELRIAPWDGWLVTFSHGKAWPTGTIRLPLHGNQVASEPAMAAWIATARCILAIALDLSDAAQSWCEQL